MFPGFVMRNNDLPRKCDAMQNEWKNGSLHNLCRYYSSDIYGMNNLISDMLSMLHWLPWAAQKWLVRSNVRNIQYMREVLNLVDPKKKSVRSVLRWTVKKSSHTASLQDGICCNQVNIWSGLVSSAQEQTPQFLHKERKTKLHESWNIIKCLRIISGKCHVLPMKICQFFDALTSELHLRMSRYKVLDPSMILQHPAVCPSTFLNQKWRKNGQATFKTPRLKGYRVPCVSLILSALKCWLGACYMPHAKSLACWYK